MKANEGTWDRVLRMAVGLALIGLTLAGEIGAWGWIGVIPLATGAVGVCPIYKMLGVNSLAWGGKRLR